MSREMKKGSESRQITILGAGLAGALLAIYLARRGYAVDVYESRSDIRKTETDHGRSINLALSCRGLTSLAAVDLLNDVEKWLVPMRARAIHEANTAVQYQPFGRHHDEYINAIIRSDLHKLLLNQAEKFPLVHLNFNMKLPSKLAAPLSCNALLKPKAAPITINTLQSINLINPFFSIN